MRALVTGASGFLGGRLVQVLSERGVDVRILARSGSRLHHLAGSKYETASGSLTEVAPLREALKSVTHVFHCAGCSTDWAPFQTYYDANVAGVRNLLRASFEAGSVERFLHVSTTDVYGYPKQPCEEATPAVDVGLPYNHTKKLGEESVLAFSEQFGLPVTVVRPATIYGPRGTAFATDIAKLLRERSMAVIDGGTAPGGFCYVDNAVDAIINATFSDVTRGRMYNLSDGTFATWRTYLDALADGLQLRRAWINIPFSVAYRLAAALEAPYRRLRLPGRPLLTRHAVYLLGRNQEYPTGRAQSDFGFAPKVSFEEGVARTVDWLKLEHP